MHGAGGLLQRLQRAELRHGAADRRARRAAAPSASIGRSRAHLLQALGAAQAAAGAAGHASGGAPSGARRRRWRPRRCTVMPSSDASSSTA